MTVLKYWNGASWQVLPAAGPKGDPGDPGAQGIDGVIGSNGGQVYSLPVGDGATLAYTVTHGLNTRGVTVTVYRTVAPYDEILCDVEHTDVNVVIVRFTTAPSTGQYVVSCAAPGTQSTFNVTMDSWHVVGAAGEPAYAANWEGYGIQASTWDNLAFRKQPDGRVVFKGLVRALAAQSAGTTIFTLPAGYRPPKQVTWDAMSGGTQARVDVSATGAVFVQSPAMSTGGYIPFDHLNFDTESVLQTASVAAVPMDSWHYVGGSGEPAFQNSWVNNDNNAPVPGTGTQRSLRFRKYPDGRVRFSGVIKTGASGTTAFTLPAGYRPAASNEALLTFAAAGPAYLNVLADGSVQPTNIGSSVVATFVYCDGLEFDTETVSAYASGFLGPPLVTVLPANPVDGQECYYLADATNGIIWRLRYRVASASAYKWEVIGGSPLASTIFASETCPGDGVTRDLTTVGPSITFPLSGDYDVTVTSNCGMGGAATATLAMLQMTDLANANFATPGNWFLQLYLTASLSERGRITGEFRLPGLVAGTGIKMRYNSSAASMNFQQREMRVQPVRVGL